MEMLDAVIAWLIERDKHAGFLSDWLGVKSNPTEKDIQDSEKHKEQLIKWIKREFASGTRSAAAIGEVVYEEIKDQTM